MLCAVAICVQSRGLVAAIVLFKKGGNEQMEAFRPKKTAMYDFEVIWLMKRSLLEVRQFKVGSFVRFATCNGQKAKYWQFSGRSKFGRRVQEVGTGSCTVEQRGCEMRYARLADSNYSHSLFSGEFHPYTR